MIVEGTKQLATRVRNCNPSWLQILDAILSDDGPSFKSKFLNLYEELISRLVSFIQLW